MPDVYKVVNATQLDAALTYTADRLRIKLGDNNDIPFDFETGKGFGDAVDDISAGDGITPTGTINISENGTYDVADKASAVVNVSGGDPYQKFNEFQVDNITSLRDPNITHLFTYAFAYRTAIENLYLPELSVLNPSNGSRYFENCTNLRTAVLPKIPSVMLEMFDGCALLTSVDFGTSCKRLESAALRSCAALSVVVLRSDTVVALANINVFASSPFANGGSGGTIYVPSALISAYQAATNWSTVNGYGTITWAQIEGSIYETQYADGTPIPME